MFLIARTYFIAHLFHVYVIIHVKEKHNILSLQLSIFLLVPFNVFM
jgi:hypothetical protein